MTSLNYMKKRFRMGQTRIEHIMAPKRVFPVIILRVVIK
jgi:hypothetical protein